MQVPLMAWVVLAALALWYVGFPALIVTAALWEKKGTPKLTAEPDEDRRGESAYARRIAEEAERQGFVRLGAWTNGKTGLLKGRLILLVSGDGGTLLLIIQAAGSRFALITMLPGDRRLVTADLSNTPDLTGWDDEEMVPKAPLEVVYRHHLGRLEALGEAAEFIEPETALEDLLAFEARRTEELIRLGLARRAYASGDQWVYTVKGALRLMVRQRRMLREVRRATERSKKLVRAHKAERAAA